MSENFENFESQEQFEYWLAHMDDALEDLMARLPADVREQLDYTPASLDVVERWILDHYDNPKAIMSDAALPDLDGAARYVGEVLRRTLGGRWRIRLDDPKYIYYGIPEITFLPEKDTPVSPLTLVTAATDRRTGKFFQLVFDGAKEMVERGRAAARKE